MYFLAIIRAPLAPTTALKSTAIIGAAGSGDGSSCYGPGGLTVPSAATHTPSTLTALSKGQINAGDRPKHAEIKRARNYVHNSAFVSSSDVDDLN